MYFGNLNDNDLNYFHHKTLVTTTYDLEEILSSTLFYTVEHGDFVEVNPLFYYDNVTVSDDTAVIRENNILVKNDTTTEFTFQSTTLTTTLQIYPLHTTDNWFIYLFNEWCKGLTNTPLKITSTVPETEPPSVTSETLTILDNTYQGDYTKYYTHTPEYTAVTTGYNGSTNIPQTDPLYIELTINNTTYCFKTEVNQ